MRVARRSHALNIPAPGSPAPAPPPAALQWRPDSHSGYPYNWMNLTKHVYIRADALQTLMPVKLIFDIYLDLSRIVVVLSSLNPFPTAGTALRSEWEGFSPSPYLTTWSSMGWYVSHTFDKVWWMFSFTAQCVFTPQVLFSFLKRTYRLKARDAYPGFEPTRPWW